MNPRRYALENLLKQAAYAQALHTQVLELSQESHGEKFHRNSHMGQQIKERRLAELKEVEAALDDELACLEPAWEAFGREAYDEVSDYLSGALQAEAS